MDTETIKCEPVRLLLGCRVEATFPHVEVYAFQCKEKSYEEVMADKLEDACEEFVSFLRDHRSQDVIQLDVVRDYATCCSACKRELEICEEDGIKYCASCGTELTDTRPAGEV